VREDGIESKHVGKSIKGSIQNRQGLEELAEVFSMPKLIDLVQLFYDEFFVLENVGCYETFENKV